MNEPDIIGDITAIFLGVLFIGVTLFIMFVPQIDRFLEKRSFFQKLKKKLSA